MGRNYATRAASAPPLHDWWRLALETGGIATSAPWVIAHRTTRMMLAGHAPSARDRREFSRMGTEKTQAAMQSAQAGWQATLQLQRAILAQALQFGWNPWLAAHQAQLAWPAIAASALVPVRRRAAANARRLSRTPLR